MIVAERVRASLARIETADAPRVTVSAGVAADRAPADGRQLLLAADQALYAAKREGRDRTCVAPDSLLPA